MNRNSRTQRPINISTRFPFTREPARLKPPQHRLKSPPPLPKGLLLSRRHDFQNSPGPATSPASGTSFRLHIFLDSSPPDPKNFPYLV